MTAVLKSAVGGLLANIKEQDTEVEFVLIGAGLPRTGTMSTFTALEQVLPGKCHHMLRAMTGKRDATFWLKAKRGEVLEEDWKQFINKEGLSAAVDYPMSLYWKDLMKMYPNAKVLLTVRDPVRWYQSVKNSIRHVSLFLEDSWMGAPIRLIGRLTGKPVGVANFTCTAPTYLGAKYPKGMFGAVDAGEETAVSYFNDWKDQVIREVPADRLLVFEVKQGWAPLCKFLDIPQPEGPFPNVNDTNEMLNNVSRMKRIGLLLWSVAAAVVSTAAYFLKDFVPVPSITFN